MSALAYLAEARDMIAEGRWVQNAFRVYNPDKKQFCYCALGAVAFAAGEPEGDFDNLNTFDNKPVKEALDLLTAASGSPFGIPTWNDDPERTQDEVVALFNKAIDTAEAALLHSAA